MPKKGKKGKGKGKKGKKGAGGKKGKAKSAKGKVDKDSELTMAVANAQLWSSRLDVTEKSRIEYREACKKLATDNEKLHETLFQSEKDTIDVITYMKQGDMEKDDKVASLEQQLRDVKKEARQEKEKLMEEFNKSASELGNKLHQRTSEVKLMQSELKMVKEFRRKRAQMQAELDEIRENLYLANREHKDTLQKMEHKFFEEKIRLEREASQKIAELAERAHTEAIASLDETTRSVYKENIRLNEALSYHIKESQTLQAQKGKLQKEVDELIAHKELTDATVKQKVTETKQNKQQILQLKDKVETLEQALSALVHEFHSEKRILEEKSHMEMAVAKTDVTRLARTLVLKERELNKVKFVAKSILDQRTSVEIFFLEALEQVRSEIVMNRAQYVQAAKVAYQHKMMVAHTGQGNYPKIRTFQKSDSSTNSVYADLSEAENWAALGNKVDIRELTWEQKEKVLRLLFAKMNGVTQKKKRKLQDTQLPVIPHVPSSPAAICDANTQNGDASGPNKTTQQETQTFLTQAEESQAGIATDTLPTQSKSKTGVTLPDINTATSAVRT